MDRLHGVGASRDEGLDVGSGSDIKKKDFRHTFLYEMDFRGSGKPGAMRQYTGTERNYRIMLDSSENPYTTALDTTARWTRSRRLGFIGVSGEKLGLPQFPDGPFQPPMPLNCAETISKPQPEP